MITSNKTKRLLAGFMAVTVTASLAFTGCASSTPKEDTKTPTAEEPATTPDASGEAPMTELNHVDADGKFIPHDYVVPAADITDEMANAIVATCGEESMDNVTLTYYYWQQYYTFVNQYGQYASMMMDFTKPLAEQMVSETQSMQDAYLQSAVDSFHAESAAYQKAMANGYTLDEATQASLDSMEADMDEYFAINGFESGAAYLAKMFGEQFTMERYIQLATISAVARGYMSMETEKLDVSQEAKDAYYAANEAKFTEQGISNTESNPVNVRHLLVTPVADEDAEVDENGKPVLTDANWKAAEEKATALYETWKNGEATEDSFAALATESSEDPGSAANGGLYEGVYVGQMVPEFDAWCFDDARAFGDSDIVKTSYGYHIMFFVSKTDTPRWLGVAETMMYNDEFQRLYEVAMDEYTMTVDFNKVALFPSPAEEENRALSLEQAANAEG